MEILHLVLAESHVPDHFNKPELDSYSYCILLGSYCDLQELEDAAGVILEMTQFELDLDSLTYNTMIKSFWNVGLLSHSILVLEEMIAKEIPTITET
ncbi:hypothetical protein AMTRI_Chr02g266010 [Amborella trichopoda]